ncbi:hypothetical protein [Actinocorallia sp. A-T 12471]|uniref:hypothetical protein n=1 Tax=Actinocorallia sp. A-T 12471 TaxID=3089813 RepID=UPI0029CECCBE|nr:hypothetical protein [Actinocorallia sp. A-T 12471]MDX6742519.1 hypothetical protein [Actinocorallia sp. A-T 12471]
MKNPDSDGSPVQGVSGNRRTGGRDLVQSPDDNSPLTLTFVLKDPGSLQDDQCPSLYRTSRRTWIIQADRRDEPDVRAQARALAPHEGLGEVTDDFMDVIARTYVKERYGLDIPG